MIIVSSVPGERVNSLTCFGMVSRVAMVKTQIFTPAVEKTAVVK